MISNRQLRKQEDVFVLENVELNKLLEAANIELGKGNYRKVRKIVNQIKALDLPLHIIAYFSSGLLIDVGGALGDINTIQEGKTLLENNFERICGVKGLAPTAHYNLGNAFLEIFSLEYQKNQNDFLFKTATACQLDQAKFHFRKALEFKINNQLAANILVNLGNCYDYLGRVVEALECYDKALNLKPDFGMALGNKGKALLYYADLCGEHQGTHILEAYSLLKSAKRGVTPEAAVGFLDCIKLIEQRDQSLPLNKPPKYPGSSIKGKSKFEQYLIDFCSQNNLYLNVCNFCKKCNAAIGDTATIKSMIVPAKDNSYLVLSSYLNEIKQDYVIARLLIVLSRYPEINLDFFDKYVTIINTLDSSLNNVYVQLTKTSFKEFYDILDKIAFFINDYLKLGIRENDINFSSMWYQDRTRKEIKQKVLQTRSASLNALYDIHKDLDYGTWRTKKEIRNALTHRFVKIKICTEKESDRIMSEETLVKQTLELAKIVRNSIIYLLQFVHVEEIKKSAKFQGLTLPIFASPIPYQLKRRRKKSRKRALHTQKPKTEKKQAN
jgi:hypothetical protein